MAFDFSKSVPTSKQLEVLEEVAEECMKTIFKLALLRGVIPEDLTYDWEPEGGIRPEDESGKQLQAELKRLKILHDRMARLGA